MASILVGVSVYAAGLVFYSALFLNTANQDPLIQAAKVGVAATHYFVVIVPIYLAQSRRKILMLAGYAGLAAFLIYAIFLVGFFRYFGFVPDVYTYGVENAGDLGEVLDHYFAQVFGIREALLLGLGALLFFFTARYHLSAWLLLLPCLSVVLLGISIGNYGTPADSDELGNATVMRRFGLVAFGAQSIGELLAMGSGSLASETAFPGPISALAGSASDQAISVKRPQTVRRVVLIQIESFDPQAINARLSGQAVMPFVAELQESCLTYTNYFTMKAAGGSADAEFAIATGLLPSMTLPSLSHFDYSRFTTTYGRLAEADVISTFSHNNQAGFYHRGAAYAKMTGVRTHFLNLEDPIDEPTFAAEGLAASLAMPDRSFYYYFNFASHGPYRGYSKATAARFSPGEKGGLRFDYLATMSEVDAMIENLFAQQRPGYDEGETLFILTADHPSYVLSPNGTIGNFNIPLLVCHAEIDGQRIETIASTLDLQATLLDAFGLIQNETLGRSLFDGGSDAALLPNRTLIRRDTADHVTAEHCGQRCDPFIDYTEQFISLSP